MRDTNELRRNNEWERPSAAVPGPRTVRRLNVDGDGEGAPAGHGGEMRAVLVYRSNIPADADACLCGPAAETVLDL